MHPKKRYGNPKKTIDNILKQAFTERVDMVIFNPETDKEHCETFSPIYTLE